MLFCTIMFRRAAPCPGPDLLRSGLLAPTWGEMLRRYWLLLDGIMLVVYSPLECPLFEYLSFEILSIWSAINFCFSSFYCSFKFLNSILKSIYLYLAESRAFGGTISLSLTLFNGFWLEALLLRALDPLLAGELRRDLPDRSVFRPELSPLDFRERPDLLDFRVCRDLPESGFPVTAPYSSPNNGFIWKPSSSLCFCLFEGWLMFFECIWWLPWICNIVLSKVCVLLTDYDPWAIDAQLRLECSTRGS